jgi:phosphoribosylamine--glycine ligase
MRGKNFLFVTTDINIGFHIINAKKEGNNIKVYSSAYKENALKGFIDDKDWVRDWKRYTGWADVIIFDDTGWGKHAEALRRRGKLVVGGTEYTDKLELDREFGQKELEKRGIRILKEHEFRTIEEVTGFIRKHPKRYVLKPCGTHEMDTTTVGELNDGSDLLELIEMHKEIWRKKKIKRFFIQEFAEGVEVAVTATFDGWDFVYPLQINFEHKRLFTGDLGPMTWEMGTLAYQSGPNKMFNDTLHKFRDKLRDVNFVGDIDISFIANEKGIFPLEFNCRYGFPEVQIYWEGKRDSSSDYLYQLASGKLKSRKASKGYNIGVVICLPPFPFNDRNELKKYRWALIKLKDRKGVYFVDTIKHGKLYLANSYCPLIVAAKAGTVEKAREEVYRRIKNVHIENMYYRLDIGSKWPRESKLLKKWGYIN